MKTYKQNAFENSLPELHENCYVAEGARVTGKVRVGEYSSIWYNCVLRADDSSITVGRYVNVQDRATIHADDDCPAVIGDYVSIGHSAIIHGCTVEDHCLIGIRSVVMEGAVIGRGSTVAAGAVVPRGMVVPPCSLVMGIPGVVKKQLPEGMVTERHKQALGYKSLWCELYGIMPDNDGEKGNLTDYKLKK